ncbi:MAG TPA: hypothetical protein VFL45_04720 [Gammaproteobacteria bacterium]|nr:hypothetical protein [Gammaproteobacteria bacterium]HET7587368.1 hypothetical protein [Gammaproteobacteria bacterium]
MTVEHENLGHAEFAKLNRAGAIQSVTVAGDREGWSILAHVRQTVYPLAARRGGVRHFRRMESAIKYLRESGIERFEVDASGYDPEAMRQTHRRPDTAAQLKRAHEAAEHDKWFREQVAAAIKEADDPNARWYTHEEVMRELDEIIERASH